MKRIFSSIFLFALMGSAWAHVENEIAYVIDEKFMTVHLTPKTLIDLLESRGIIIDENQQFNLSDHSTEYADYFNERMDLHLDGESVEFIYRSANLNDHDASLQFEMKSYAQQASSLELELTCFLDIYNRPKNLVQWKTKNGLFECRLDKNNTSCNLDLNAKEDRKDRDFIYFLIASVVIGLLLLSLYIRRARSK